MSRWVAVLALAALVGCAPDNGTAVLLTIDGTMLDSSQRAAIVELDFDVEGVESYRKSLPLGRSLSPSGRERILYKSQATSGHLAFSIVARDGANAEQARGSQGADLRDGETVSATLPLGAERGDGGDDSDGGDVGGGDDSGAPDGGGLRITPMRVSVPVTRAQLFTANQAVSWSVMEGAAGGDVDDSGKYWAPLAPGTYHVVATSLSDSTNSATATITAAPLSLKLLAGNAGGPGNLDGVGSAARFANPTGLCELGSYVADTGNHTIRVIAGAPTQQVSTIAGNGSPGDVDGVGTAAQLSSPAGIDCDSSSVYIADSGNGKIKKLLKSTGAVTTFASGFSRPADVLIDSVGGRLFVADATTNIIYYLSLSDPSPSPIALAGTGQWGAQDNVIGLSASFSSPKRLAQPIGNQLLVGDNNGVRSIDLTAGNNAAVTTLTGTGPLGGPVTALSPAYVATQTALYTITPRDMASDLFTLALGGQYTGWADGDINSALFTNINYIEHSNGAVSDDDVIRQVGGGSNPRVTTLAGLASQLAVVDGTGAAASFSQVTGITIDDTGHAWLTDNNAVRQVDLTSGAVTTLTLTPSPATTPSPGPTDFLEGLAYYNGALYLVSTNRHTLNRVDPATGISTVLAGELGVNGSNDGVGTAAHFNAPLFVVSDGHGALYLSDSGNNMIRSYDVASGMVSTVAGNPEAGSTDAIGKLASFSHPDGLALDGNGSLYVADRGNLVIRKIDLASGAVSRLAGGYSQSGTTDGTLDQARFEGPWALACDGHSLFVTSLPSTTLRVEPAVRRIDLASGMVTHFVGTTTQHGIVPGPLPALISSDGYVPLPLAITPAGDLLLADFSAFLIVQP